MVKDIEKILAPGKLSPGSHKAAYQKEIKIAYLHSNTSALVVFQKIYVQTVIFFLLCKRDL